MNGDGSQTIGPPYSVAVRITGADQTLALSTVRFIQANGGSGVIADNWRRPVPDGEGTILLFDPSGVALARSDHTVTGLLLVGGGDAVREYSFTGSLGYRYRSERRNWIWDFLGGA